MGNWYKLSDHSADDTAGVPFINDTFDIPVQTRYIMIAKTDTNYLHLAEVQVMGH
jgi:hypothetical protein